MEGTARKHIMTWLCTKKQIFLFLMFIVMMFVMYLCCFMSFYMSTKAYKEWQKTEINKTC